MKVDEASWDVWSKNGHLFASVLAVATVIRDNRKSIVKDTEPNSGLNKGYDQGYIPLKMRSRFTPRQMLHLLTPSYSHEDVDPITRTKYLAGITDRSK
jgi:hypothetical protein